MQRWGTTSAGKERWRCATCEVSGIRRRKDNRARARLSLFVRWVTGKATLTEIARARHVTRQAVSAWFNDCWTEPPPSLPNRRPRVLVVDGTGVTKRECMLLVGVDGASGAPVSWMPTVRECFDAWHRFLSSMKDGGAMPEFVVCDGQRGLLKAIPRVWPDARVQRCTFHVIRQASIWLTQNPKTEAGRRLRAIVLAINLIRSDGERRAWLVTFDDWRRCYDDFLKERTHGDGKRWWYTHRKLRAVRSLLFNAIPDLFRYVDDPRVPNTSNHVEGGINSRIKELIRCHRGISTRRKLMIAGWYLAKRQGQKPTRKFT